MTTFIDASVLVAVMGFESDALEWTEMIADAEKPSTSAIAMWETVRAVSRLRGIAPERAQSELAAVLVQGCIEIVPIGEQEAKQAILAHVSYGKGNHPAKLNMGDCFAYACAKTNNARLLYKGSDFSETDLA